MFQDRSIFQSPVANHNARLPSKPRSYRKLPALNKSLLSQSCLNVPKLSTHNLTNLVLVLSPKQKVFLSPLRSSHYAAAVRRHFMARKLPVRFTFEERHIFMSNLTPNSVSIATLGNWRTYPNPSVQILTPRRLRALLRSRCCNVLQVAQRLQFAL